VDGVMLCVGKNGDDAAVLREILPRLENHPRAGHADPAQRPFLLQLSTLSSGFAGAVHQACRQRGLVYGNYPLTGGPAGAQAASMLILCSGEEPLYYRVEPLLQILGNPRFFGPAPTAAAEVKLIGHYMVFGGLTGLTAAAALQRQCLPESDPVEFFDFLNNGAGGTKQWDVALRKGLADQHWNTGFFCRHGVIDTLYATKLAIQKNLPLPVTLTMLQMALLLGRALKNDSNAATHAIYHQFHPDTRAETDAFLRENLADLDPPKILERTLAGLPEEIRAGAGLDEKLEI
jgi:3-hydroxyisobutyrate dehydrogenase